MLGMMNCSFDCVDFYEASPAMKRILATDPSLQHDKDTNSENSATLSEASSGGEDVSSLRLFSEAKHRPGVSYTSDGRKMVDGKMSEEATMDPDKMWNRLIVGSLVGRMTVKKDNGNTNAEAAKEAPEAGTKALKSSENKSGQKK